MTSETKKCTFLPDSCLPMNQTVFRRLNTTKYMSNKDALEYETLSGKKIILDKIDLKLGEHFLENHISKSYAKTQIYQKNMQKFLEEIYKLNKNPKLPVSHKILIKEALESNPKKFMKLMAINEPPLSQRWTCWYTLITKDSHFNQKKFERLVKGYKKDVASIVMKDVLRTFPRHEFFNKKVEGINVGKEMLYKVCKAVGTYFTDVGYCQGLNFLVAYLLQISSGNQIECLNMMVSLMTNNKFLIIGLYDEMFPLVQFLKFLFHEKLKIVNKGISDTIKKSFLPDDVWLTKWFISLFSGYLPEYHVARALDFIFSRDIFAVVSYTLALVLSLEKKIRDQEIDVLNFVLNNLHKALRAELEDPSLLNKLASKMILGEKWILKKMEEFLNKESLMGSKEFKKYSGDFKAYLEKEILKNVDSFKMYNFNEKSTQKSMVNLLGSSCVNIEDFDKNVSEDSSKDKSPEIKEILLSLENKSKASHREMLEIERVLSLVEDLDEGIEENIFEKKLGLLKKVKIVNIFN